MENTVYISTIVRRKEGRKTLPGIGHKAPGNTVKWHNRLCPLLHVFYKLWKSYRAPRSMANLLTWAPVTLGPVVRKRSTYGGMWILKSKRTKSLIRDETNGPPKALCLGELMAHGKTNNIDGLWYSSDTIYLFEHFPFTWSSWLI